MNSRTRNDEVLAWAREANPISEAEVAAELSGEEIREEMARAMAIGAGEEGSKLRTGYRFARARGFRIAAVGLSVLAFGGTAMATSGVWNPFAGTSGETKVSNTAVPAGMVAKLGVLRNAQADRDRSPAVEATLKGTLAQLKYMGDFAMRLGSVRRLPDPSSGAPRPSGRATILLSGVRTERPLIEPDEGRWTADVEVICVSRPIRGIEEDTLVCFDRSELMTGQAIAGIGDRDGAETTYGVVPDGVATVTVERVDAPAVTVQVSDNYWEFSGRNVSSVRTVWQDEAGNFIRRPRPSASWWVRRVRQEAKTDRPYGP